MLVGMGFVSCVNIAILSLENKALDPHILYNPTNKSAM